METELEIIKNMPGIAAATFFSVKVVTLHMNYLIGTDTQVKLLVDGKHVGVEAAVADILSKAGYKVFRGDNVHIASFALARKCLTYVDEYSCFSDEEKAVAKRLIKQSNTLLKDFLAGRAEKLSPLLGNMKERWKLGSVGTQIKDRGFIDTFIQFLSSNPEVAETWIKCYNGLPYDPRGAPDLFAWSENTNRWFWIEVKSFNDSLRPEQWAWIEHFQGFVGQNVTLVRIIPSKYQEPSQAVGRYIAVNTSHHNGEPVFKSMTYQVSRILRELVKNPEEVVMTKYKLTLEEINAAKAYAKEQKEITEEGASGLVDQMQ